MQIRRVEYVHSKLLLSRDIKPENILIGRHSIHKESTIYVVDFGLAKKYIDAENHMHIPYRKNMRIVGTQDTWVSTHISAKVARLSANALLCV